MAVPRSELGCWQQLLQQLHLRRPSFSSCNKMILQRVQTWSPTSYYTCNKQPSASKCLHSVLECSWCMASAGRKEETVAKASIYYWLNNGRANVPKKANEHKRCRSGNFFVLSSLTSICQGISAHFHTCDIQSPDHLLQRLSLLSTKQASAMSSNCAPVQQAQWIKFSMRPLICTWPMSLWNANWLTNIFAE